jgi:hypothetical protein
VLQLLEGYLRHTLLPGANRLLRIMRWQRCYPTYELINFVAGTQVGHSEIETDHPCTTIRRSKQEGNNSECKYKYEHMHKQHESEPAESELTESEPAKPESENRSAQEGEVEVGVIVHRVFVTEQNYSLLREFTFEAQSPVAAASKVQFQLGKRLLYRCAKFTTVS